LFTTLVFRDMDLMSDVVEPFFVFVIDIWFKLRLEIRFGQF
jgi:hypothetical protein